MVEYIYDAIIAVAGQDITIYALITDDEENVITSDCSITLHDDDGELLQVDGTYLPENEMWEFTIPADGTLGLNGRYWYCVRHDGSNLCFKQPIYLKK